MRSSAALILSLLGGLVSSTPIPFPIVLTDELPPLPASPASHHQPPPAPVASARPKHALPETIPLYHVGTPSSTPTTTTVAVDDDDAALQEPIDNSPLTPSASTPPSAVLAVHKPVVSSYLLSLAPFNNVAKKLYAATTGHGRAGAEKERRPSDPAELAAAARGGDDDEKEEGEEGGRGGVPVYYPMAGRECTDLLAMGLFALFLSVVVVVEAWAAIFYSARKLFSRRGAIHLEENQPNGPLSVRSDASYASCPATEEKRGI